MSQLVSSCLKVFHSFFYYKSPPTPARFQAWLPEVYLQSSNDVQVSRLWGPCCKAFRFQDFEVCFGSLPICGSPPVFCLQLVLCSLPEFVHRNEGSFSFVGDLTHRTPMGNTDSKLCLSAYLVRPLLSSKPNEQNKTTVRNSNNFQITTGGCLMAKASLGQVGRRYTRSAAGWLQTGKTHEVIRFGRKRATAGSSKWMWWQDMSTGPFHWQKYIMFFKKKKKKAFTFQFWAVCTDLQIPQTLAPSKLEPNYISPATSFCFWKINSQKPICWDRDRHRCVWKQLLPRKK